MLVTFGSQTQLWNFSLLHLENQKRYVWIYFWFKNSRILAFKFYKLLHLRLTYHWCKNERYSISRTKAQIFPSQIHRLKFANFSTKNTFKYSAFDSLIEAKKNFTIAFDYQKLQAFLFPLPIISGQTLIKIASFRKNSYGTALRSHLIFGTWMRSQLKVPENGCFY